MNHMESRVTSNHISKLAEGEIFVFGSNADGIHAGGAARLAAQRFGAVMGQGHGLQGRSYAIDSMSGKEAMQKDVDDFIEFAKQHAEYTFLVTRIGCGIAGMTPEEVAPMFAQCIDLGNVCLPAAFWDVIGWPEADYDLARFVKAQDGGGEYERALQELRNGHKSSHWIWYIFPQQKGIGHSSMSKFYGLDGIGEAKAYLSHPILGSRLRECCEALLDHRSASIRSIMGSGIDVRKLRSSMTLFNQVSSNDVFAKVLEAFYK